MKTIRIGVVGAGHLGRIHARLLHQHAADDVEFVAVVDPVAENRLSIAAENGVRAYAQAEELIGAVDAAIVAAPTKLHREVAGALLEAGVHVLVEKPIATDSREATELVSLAARRRLTLQVGHVERFNPAFEAIATRSSRPTFIEATRHGVYTGRSTDVSVVLDLMIHDIDLALALCDEPVVEVGAHGGTVFGPHFDWAEAELRFASGAVAHLSASRVAPSATRTLRTIDEQGWGWIDFQAKTAKRMTRGKAIGAGQPTTSLEWTHVKERLFVDYLPVETLTIPSTNAIQDEQRDFIRAIRTGATPRVDGRAGAVALEIAERIHAAITDRLATETPDTLPLRRAA
jgi:predicted dehydrogenase